MSLKYADTAVTFAEIPGEITLCINISNCPCHCKGCHSSYLAKDIGEPLNKLVLKELIEKNEGISCICFMGGDSNPLYLNAMMSYIKTHSNLLVAWYSGRQELPSNFNLKWVDFIKLGPYIEELGPLNKKTTNQKMFQVIHNPDSDRLFDITYKFQKA